MKFGVFSVSMPEYTVEEAPRIAKELGYDFIEWRVGSMPKEEPKDYPYERRYWACNKSTLDENNIMADCLRAKKACDEAGIEIVGISPSLPLEADEKFEAVCRAAQAIGCKELYGWLDGAETLDAALEKLKQSTRRYAKRQLTWFGADKRIHWIEPDAQEEGETPLDRAMKLLEKEGTA